MVKALFGIFLGMSVLAVVGGCRPRKIVYRVPRIILINTAPDDNKASQETSINQGQQ